MPKYTFGKKKGPIFLQGLLNIKCISYQNAKEIDTSVCSDSLSVWLDLSSKILNKRTRWNKKRPLLNKTNNQKKIDELYAKRKNIYKLANHKIICDKLNKKNIANKIIKLYEKY